MMKTLVFCSNPINGGTAEMFVQMVLETQKQLSDDNLIVPCVNENNNVKVYNMLPGLVRLAVFSEEQAFGKYLPNSYSFINFVKKIARKIWYRKIKIANLKIMRDFLKGNNYSSIIIHNGGYGGDDLCNQMLQAAYEVGIFKRIMVFHNDFVKKLLGQLRYFYYDKNIDKWATELVTVSKYTRDRMKSLSFIKKDIMVIYNGIEFNDTQSLAKKKKLINYISDDSAQIGMVGNFMHNKGQLYFLKALNQVYHSCAKPIRVTLIGNICEEKYYLQCKNYIETHDKLVNVQVVHNVYNAREYMQLFNFVVVPSIYDESFGLIGVEAMRAAVPVVAFACGGIPEVIENNRDGIIVENKNIYEMAKAIITLIEKPELAQEMGMNGRADYEARFSRSVMGKRYVDLLTH